MKPSSVKEEISCFHCGDHCYVKTIKQDEKNFCCEGCKTVYNILQQGNLCTYYDLNKNPGIKGNGIIDKDRFAFLDEEKIKTELLNFKDQNEERILLFIPQIHCSSCLYLLEHLSDLHAGILATEVNFTHKELLLIYEPQKISLRELVHLLSNLGYEPQLNKGRVQNGAPIKSNFNQKQLQALGVAGACFVGIMMLSLPEYVSGGKLFSASLQKFFPWANFLLALPAVFISSQVFFTSAIKALYKKHVNTDTPIAIAILVTFIFSVYQLILKEANAYFDSLCGLIFFMLLGRWIQERTYKLIQHERNFVSFFPIAFTKIGKDKKHENIALKEIKFADEIIIYPNDIIPVDGIITAGDAEIDYSFVTGESKAIFKEVSDIVYAGGKLLNQKIIVYALKEPSQSYLTSLWNNASAKHKKAKPKYADNLSAYFTIFVFIVAVLTAIFWLWKNPSNAIWSFASILIVACPCAILLAETFTKGNILRHLSRLEIFVKNARVLDTLAEVDFIVMDKTGTLTDAKLHDISYNGRQLTEEEKNIIFQMTIQSRHPYSQAIAQYLNADIIDENININEIAGKGLECFYKNNYVRLGSESFVLNQAMEGVKDSAEVFLSINMEFAGIFKVKNYYRKHLAKSFKTLSKNYESSILSGDNDAEKNNLKKLFSSEIALLFQHNPQQKQQYIQNLQDRGHTALMIGDGLNDNGALQQADCGIVICEKGNNFFPGGDILMSATSFYLLPNILALTKKIKPIIYSSFALSLIYNFTGIFFAMQAKLNPMIAAILMPASSITIILVTFGLTQNYAYQYLYKKSFYKSKENRN